MPDQYYLAKKADFTLVADAIRTKGDTSAPLEFPTEFVSAVDAIPTGGAVSPLSVSSNGVYTAPTGEGYSPVTVAVPTYEATLAALLDGTIEDAVVPFGTTQLVTYAFYQRRQLRSCVLPEGITSIGGMAFDSCGALKSINIPSTVKNISTFAFRNCTSMEKIIFQRQTPPSVNMSDNFGNLPSSCIITIPYASTAYLTATNYPSPSTYLYLGFYASTSGETLPATAGAYSLTWYASTADAQAQTNPITTGNGGEVYCRYA